MTRYVFVGTPEVVKAGRPFVVAACVGTDLVIAIQ